MRLPPSATLTAFASLIAAFATAASAPSLEDFRTVATAKTATIEKGGITSGGRPGYLGVELTGDPTALVVGGVALDSSAQNAGLQAGDIISKIATTDVQNVRALREAIQSLGDGASAQIHLTRSGKPLELTVQLSTASHPKVLPARQPILGLRLSRSHRRRRPRGPHRPRRLAPGARWHEIRRRDFEN